MTHHARHPLVLSLAGMILLTTATLAHGQLPASVAARPDHYADAEADPQNGRFFRGQPLSYWIACIRNRDEEHLDSAFSALLALGPEAAEAVPELTQILAQPFTPIRIGSDTRRDIQSKILDISLRASATDALGAIGEAAAPSAGPLIHWGLTLKVALSARRSALEKDMFVDLVALDVLERMRVAGAVAQIGAAAAPEVEKLLASSDGEQRKFGVAILNDGILPIAADLLKSSSCRDRVLGVFMLTDMWTVVPREHLVALKDLLVCDGN